MMDNTIRIKKDDVLRLRIIDANEVDTGEMITIDLEDIDLPLKLQEMVEKDKKNKEYLRNQLLIIEKRQDVKGKKLFSKNEEDQLKALKDFFEKEEKIYDMFLGNGAVKKLLCGRKLGWTTLEEIDEIIDKQIKPYLNVNMDNIKNKIKEKYQQAINKDKEVL